MNMNDRYDDDILKQYINTESIEKAPEDFTHNVMREITVEREPLKAKGKLRTGRILAAVFVIIIVILVIIAANIPGGAREPSSLIGKLQNFDFPELNISLESILSPDLPGLLMYLCVAVLFLGVFDVALYGLFHRERK